MLLSELASWCSQKVREYPLLEERIMDLYWIAHDEVEDGGSSEHESELCMGSVKELIEQEYGGN